MKAIIQRVTHAKVSVDGKTISSISRGILTFLGIATGDQEESMQKIITKISELRIFPDENGKMNLSLKDIQGEHLIVSQFTLYADTSKGRRPSFIQAEKPDRANELYQKALEFSANLGIPTQGGKFQSDMKIELLNDGPVTIALEEPCERSS